MIIVICVAILAPFTTATYDKVGFPEIHRRQVGNCTDQCCAVEPALACNTTECACPILNSAGSTGVTACVNCLQTVSPLTASNITLFANVCSMCESQCSTSLTAYIQTLSCNTTACECSLYLRVGSTALTTCATCVQTFNPTDADGLLAFAQACGVNVTVPSASASQTPSHSSSGGSTIPTVSATSTSRASAVATVTTSAACQLEFRLFWSTIFLGLSVVTFLI
jgi:hypothetical protein